MRADQESPPVTPVTGGESAPGPMRASRRPITRRRAVREGAAATAGVAASVYVAPAILTIQPPVRPAFTF